MKCHICEAVHIAAAISCNWFISMQDLYKQWQKWIILQNVSFYKVQYAALLWNAYRSVMCNVKYI